MKTDTAENQIWKLYKFQTAENFTTMLKMKFIYIPYPSLKASTNGLFEKSNIWAFSIRSLQDDPFEIA